VSIPFWNINKIYFTACFWEKAAPGRGLDKILAEKGLFLYIAAICE
jgi:hypothetical protein